jgi:spore coat polysaccharide biosynthesis protein SpsF
LADIVANPADSRKFARESDLLGLPALKNCGVIEILMVTFATVSQTPIGLGAIIACRMDSSRFPGKVLKHLRGKPVLEHVIHRCQRMKSLEHGLAVATTKRPVDDAIIEFCESLNVPVFRGSTDNVAGRLLDCAHSFGFDRFFRVNADSPLLDPSLLDQAAGLYHDDAYDLVTNLHPRTFPYGISVELLRTNSFADAVRRMSRPEHFEHVTSYHYEHPETFRIFNLANPRPLANPCRLTVDTPEDLERLEYLLSGSSSQSWIALTEPLAATA